MNAVVNLKPGGAAPSKGASNAGSEIQSRYSQELIIALSGPLGSGVSLVTDLLRDALTANGYEVVHVKISEQFLPLAKDLSVPFDGLSKDEYERVSRLQDLGNALRDALGHDVGAQVAIKFIAQDRLNRHPDDHVNEIKPGRVAYIINQLKNPFEAALLRDVYGNMFFLVGVLAGYKRRQKNLKSVMSSVQAESLIERDWAEAGGGGQQLEKTLKMADYFVRNSQDNTQDLKKNVDRFVDLIHGQNGISPTINERGMYAAQSAALRSACLSRQVGAAILDSNGNTIATGCNDVPKAGGGLYEEGPEDHRCVFREGGRCFNDKHKDMLRDEIAKLLRDGGIDVRKAEELAGQIRGKTRLRDLIEFSRAVHAEMDALIAAARKGGSGVQDCILFTTTYPCHNCARHIVAAGIRAVYFIEPYGKSLATELHDDSIVHDDDSYLKSGQTKMVSFLHFDGVAPRRFSDLFYAIESRKDASGRAKHIDRISAPQRAPELLDNYKQLEAKIAERITRKVLDSAAATNQ